MKARWFVISTFLVGLTLLTLIVMGAARPATAQVQQFPLPTSTSISDRIQVTATWHTQSTSVMPIQDISQFTNGARYCDPYCRTVLGPEGSGERLVTRTDIEMGTTIPCAYPLPDGMCIYYGDLHSHTGYSDGQGTPQQAYEMARSNGLDFFAITDHAEQLNTSEWKDTLAQAQAATVEDHFVALRGFEWTSNYGHLNVFNTDGLVRATDSRYNSLGEFYAWLSDPAQINSVAQFNHPFYPPQDPFDNWRHDPLADRHVNLIEIRNGDISCVHEYNVALAAGWRVAATNNSDTHWSNWGERRARTGIVAPGLTYYHVINSLRARRTFSTDDENLSLAMRANGSWMGSVISNGPVYFDIYAFDPDPADSIAALELYWNGYPFQSTVVHTNAFTWSLALSTPPPPGTWWYAKATQNDGDKAYTSPILTYQPDPYDVLIRDNMWDIGDVPSADPAWQSPDIWVRHQADGQMWHENPVAGETNQVYARVQNIGSNPLADVDVYIYWANPSLGFVWPDSWRPITFTPVHIHNLAPGETATVSVPWDVSDSVPRHACLLVRLASTQDPIRYKGHPKWDNNIGWKNVHIVDASDISPPGALVLEGIQFYLANPFAEEKTADVHISSDDFPAQGSITLRLDTELFDRWIVTDTSSLVKGAVIDPISRTIAITSPVDAVVYGLPLQAGENSTATLVLYAPPTSTLAVRVSEQIGGEEIGGNLYTTLPSSAPRKISLKAAADRIEIEESVGITAVVVGDGFVPVVDGTEVRLSTTLGSLSTDTVQTRNGIVTATLDAGTIPGTAIVQASVSGLVSATAAVNIDPTCWVRLNDDPFEYLTIQAAVDASTHSTDVVKVAGRCTVTNTHGGLVQVVYISKTLTVRGGYTATNWTTADPVANPTTLDAKGQGRVFYIIGSLTGSARVIGPTIEGLHITGGDASGLGGGPSGKDAGGGVYVVSTTATIRNNWVFGNTAQDGGGLDLSASDVTLINNLVVGNRADSLGGGLYIEGSLARMLHTTIAHNGNGVHVTHSGARYSTVALTNTVLVSHTVGITVTAGNTATLEATLWGSDTWANGTDWEGGGAIITGTHNYWGDPAFLDPGTGDYHIGADSAALDTGVDAGVSDDVDSDPRPMGRGYDIGADELRIGLTVAKRTDSGPVRAGKPLAYTIHVTNTGNLDLHITITDTLPTHILAGTTDDGTAVSPGETITWRQIVTAPGGVWTQQVVVTVETGYTGALTNVARVKADESATVYTATSIVVVEYPLYLPLVMRDFSPPIPCAPRLVTEVETGPEPYAVALDTAGRRAFVAHNDGVTVIDTNNFTVITTTNSFSLAHGIAYDPDRDRLWVARRDPDRVIVLDGATYTQLADLPAGNGPHSVAHNPANGRIYVTNYWGWTVMMYDAETLTYLGELTGFAEPAHLAVNPVTNKIYVANHRPNQGIFVIDGATHDSHRISTTLLDAYGVAVDTTRNLVYATGIAQGRISVIDGATDVQVGFLDIQDDDGHAVWVRVIAVNPNVGTEGHLLLVTSSNDGELDQLLLIPNGWPTLGTPVPLDIASYPQEGIAVDQDEDRVWVTSTSSGLVSVVQDGEPVCSTLTP